MSRHGFNQGFLSERAPNLWDVPARAEERLKHEKYHMNDPAARDTVQKEAFEGSGTATTGQEYIAESHACPNCFVVPGFGVKGTNDTESPMPRIHKPRDFADHRNWPLLIPGCTFVKGRKPYVRGKFNRRMKKFIPEETAHKRVPTVMKPQAACWLPVRNLLRISS